MAILYVIDDDSGKPELTQYEIKQTFVDGWHVYQDGASGLCRTMSEKWDKVTASDVSKEHVIHRYTNYLERAIKDNDEANNQMRTKLSAAVQL